MGCDALVDAPIAVHRLHPSSGPSYDSGAQRPSAPAPRCSTPAVGAIPPTCPWRSEPLPLPSRPSPGAPFTPQPGLCRPVWTPPRLAPSSTPAAADANDARRPPLQPNAHDHHHRGGTQWARVAAARRRRHGCGGRPRRRDPGVHASRPFCRRVRPAAATARTPGGACVRPPPSPPPTPCCSPAAPQHRSGGVANRPGAPGQPAASAAACAPAQPARAAAAPHHG